MRKFTKSLIRYVARQSDELYAKGNVKGYNYRAP